jgi:uncharacterized protein HemY
MCSRNDEYMKQALSYYEKYTDFVDSFIRFIVVKDYKALEIEAEKMKQIDKINPRILRYLGYSAYYNDNVDVAIKSLQDYTSIQRDIS